MIRTIDIVSVETLLKDIKLKPKEITPLNLSLPIILYGAGNLGRMAIEYLQHIKVPFEFILDRNAEKLKMDKYWSNFPVFPVSECPKHHKSESLILVCVTNFPFSEILQKLNELGWRNVMPFYDFAESFLDIHPLSNGWRLQNLSKKEWVKVEQSLDAWGDDISRAHHLQFMAWRRHREDWLFKNTPIDIHNRFFIPEVVRLLQDDERFLDVGAHIGITLNKFIEIRQRKFEKIWAIEPDLNNAKSLTSAVQNLPKYIGDRVEVINLAVSNSSKPRKFISGLGYSSQFGDSGEYMQTTTIDALNLTPTFIKFHLEGAEQESLEGSILTINKNRPIVAATCYHGKEGVYSLPSWFNENLDDYLILFRLHGWCGCGAVIYAIPNEKISNYEKN